VSNCTDSLHQGYSNGGPRSESRPLNGDGRNSSASQRCILYPEIFIPKFCVFGRTSKAFTPRQLCDCRSSCCSVNCSVHLSWVSYDFLVQSNCFVTIVQKQLVTTVSIPVKIVDSRQEYSNETFSFRKQYNYTNLFVHSCERCLSKGRVLQRFWSFRK